MEIKINDKTFELKELKYKIIASLGDLSKEESVKKLMILSTDMTEEQYDDLSLKEGITLQKEINKLNGLDDDFQKPLTN